MTVTVKRVSSVGLGIKSLRLDVGQAAAATSGWRRSRFTGSFVVIGPASSALAQHAVGNVGRRRPTAWPATVRASEAISSPASSRIQGATCPCVPYPVPGQDIDGSVPLHAQRAPGCQMKCADQGAQARTSARRAV